MAHCDHEQLHFTQPLAYINSSKIMWYLPCYHYTYRDGCVVAIYMLSIIVHALCQPVINIIPFYNVNLYFFTYSYPNIPIHRIFLISGFRPKYKLFNLILKKYYCLPISFISVAPFQLQSFAYRTLMLWTQKK